MMSRFRQSTGQREFSNQNMFWGSGHGGRLSDEFLNDYHRVLARVEILENEVQSLRNEIERMKSQSNSRNRTVDCKPHFIKEIPMPCFKGGLNEDPLEFMKDLEQYLMIKRVPDEYQPKVVRNALQENARTWFDAIKSDLNSFIDFSRAFCDEYCSIEAQERRRDLWRGKRYSSNADTLVTYYYKQLGEASNLQPPISISEKNRIILAQLPLEVQVSMAGTNLSDSRQFVKTLIRIDDARGTQRLSRKK